MVTKTRVSLEAFLAMPETEPPSELIDGEIVQKTGPVAVNPDFAIEVVSPGDYPGRIFERADFYMRAGTGLLWFVDPETESITAYRPGQAPTVHRAPAVIGALPVLRDFHLDVASLFAYLHDDAE
jgi:Uma2 family endonuclease